jgi:cellulose synthase/poly-beta-1,6-N-acetylglucosamine synthase-like glycosyltransferase
MIATIFSIFYHRILYMKRLRPSFDRTYQPRCSVILPCKGIPHNFEKNIRSFFTLDYPDYEVIFTVESEQDPCVPLIRKILTEQERASLVVAGITKKCSQKNFNMIAAINGASDSDVYVFADSDISLSPDWLRELILPLSSDKITVTSGFRWLYATSGTLGALVNAYQNTMLLVLFSTSSFIQDIGLWGGSMAIRRKDFQDLGVREYWSETVVDDISLSRLVMKHAKKSIMVSTCITPTDDTLPTIKQSIQWFHRQVMFLKAYQKGAWIFALVVVTSSLLLQLLLPVSIVVSLTTAKSFTEAGGVPSLIFFFGTMSTTLLYPLLGKRNPRWRSMVMVQPLSLFTMFYGTLKTLFTNTVKWSGFWYKLNFRGKVISVDRQ